MLARNWGPCSLANLAAVARERPAISDLLIYPHTNGTQQTAIACMARSDTDENSGVRLRCMMTYWMGPLMKLARVPPFDDAYLQGRTKHHLQLWRGVACKAARKGGLIPRCVETTI